MNANIKALALALLATGALNVAALPATATPVAKLQISGGMPAPGSIGSQMITIQDNGEVRLDEYYNNEDWDSTAPGKEVHVTIAQLNVQDMQALEADIANLSGGMFKNSHEPRCEDAPDEDYSIFKNGQEILIYKQSGCREFPLKNRRQRAHATKIKALLDQLRSLSYK